VSYDYWALLGDGTIPAPWIDPIDGVITDIPIQVHIGSVSEGISLQKPPQTRRVAARTVVIQARLGVEFAGGEGEAVGDD